jgi:hypothetical protein
VGKSSPSRLENKSSIHLVACRMNPSVVPNAAKQEKHSVVEVVAASIHHAIKTSGMYTKCSMQDEDFFKSDKKRLAYCSDRCNKVGLGDHASIGER